MNLIRYLLRVTLDLSCLRRVQLGRSKVKITLLFFVTNPANGQTC